MKSLFKKADIWAPPPNMMERIERFAISAFCTLVVKDTRPALSVIQQYASVSFEIVRYWDFVRSNLKDILSGLQVGQSKSWKSPDLNGERFTMDVVKLDEDKFSLELIITRQDKLSGISYDILTETLSKQISELSKLIDAHVNPKYLVALQSVVISAEKMISEPVDFSSQFATIDVPLDFTGWKHFDSIAKGNEAHQNDVREKMSVELDRAGRFMDQANTGTQYIKFDFEVEGYPQYNCVIDYDPSTGGFTFSRQSWSTTVIGLEKAKKLLRSGTTDLVDSFHTSDGQEAVVDYIESNFSKLSELEVRFGSAVAGEALGMFFPDKFKIEIYNPGSNIADDAAAHNMYPDAVFEMRIDNLKDTVRHEVQHAIQYISSVLLTGSRNKSVAGFPNKSQAPFRGYNEYGVPKDGLSVKGPVDNSDMLIHALRDIEYLTRLSDDISRFNRIKKLIPKKLLNKAISYWTSASNELIYPFTGGIAKFNEVQAQEAIDRIKSDGWVIPSTVEYLQKIIDKEKPAQQLMDGVTKEFKIFRGIASQLRQSDFFANLKKYTGPNRKPEYVMKVFQDNVDLVPNLYQYVQDRLSGKPSKVTEAVKSDIDWLLINDKSFDSRKFADDLNSAIMPSRWVRAVKTFYKEVQ